MKISAPVIIAQMQESDLPAVCELEREIGLSSLGLPGYRRKLQERGAVLLTACSPRNPGEAPSLVGLFSGWVVVDELQIDNLVVSEPFRRRGIAGSLLTAALGQAREKGALTATLEVRASNLAAQALYQRYGFSIVGRRTGYYSAGQEAALLMSAALADYPATSLVNGGIVTGEKERIAT
jgi:ribosomal-protein-alanine N-acetyltransferase